MSEDTAVCKNCGHEVAQQSMMMHEVQCARHNARCHCGAVVPKKDLEAHEQEVHSKVPCPHCKREFEKQAFASHVCPKIPRQCEHCELQFPGDMLAAHEEECGNRTEQCLNCKKFIPKRNLIAHSLSRCMPELPRESKYEPARPAVEQRAPPQRGAEPRYDQSKLASLPSSQERQPEVRRNPVVPREIHREIPREDYEEPRRPGPKVATKDHRPDENPKPKREIKPSERHTQPTTTGPAGRSYKPPSAQVATEPKARAPNISHEKPARQGPKRPAHGSVPTELKQSYKKVIQEAGKARSDRFISQPITAKREEQKASGRAGQVKPPKVVDSLEEEDRKIAEAFQKSLLEAQALEDAQLAAMLAKEAEESADVDYDYTRDDAELARRLEKEDQDARADSVYDRWDR